MLCPKCESEMSLRPGGISYKRNPAGVPYGAFYSCPNCKQTIDAGGEVPPKPEPGAKPYVDPTAVGKVASNFIQALIASGKSPVGIEDYDIRECFELAKKVVYWGRGE